jgi:hypothetical protein
MGTPPIADRIAAPAYSAEQLNPNQNVFMIFPFPSPDLSSCCFSLSYGRVLCGEHCSGTSRGTFSIICEHEVMRLKALVKKGLYIKCI